MRRCPQLRRPDLPAQGHRGPAALAAGAHCVDVAGDDPAAEDLLNDGDPAREGRSVILSAGALPGLSAILPRWLARQDLDEVSALTAHCGGLESCSPTVAVDLMLSLTAGGANGAAYGEPLAAVRGGRRLSRALRAVEDAEIPAFPAGWPCSPSSAARANAWPRVLGWIGWTGSTSTPARRYAPC